MQNSAQYLTLDEGQRSADNTRVFTVTEGHYFVMGDNRDNSADSRFAVPTGVGLVPAENLVGRAEILFFSTNGRAHFLGDLALARGDAVRADFPVGARDIGRPAVARPTVDDLCAQLGHSFADPAILDEALTHASADRRRERTRDNERLEFLGDRVLGLVIADHLLRRYAAADAGALGPPVQYACQARKLGRGGRANRSWRSPQAIEKRARFRRRSQAGDLGGCL